MSRSDQDPMSLLHPVFREQLLALLAHVHAEGLPFAFFEGYRGPQRQAALYNIGRTGGVKGKCVTRARAWESFHQYGLAADLVLRVEGKWSWENGPGQHDWWKRMHELAREQGLEPLPWELCHVQSQGLLLEQLGLGHYPAGGDWSWANNLAREILGWRGEPEGPPVPRIP